MKTLLVMVILLQLIQELPAETQAEFCTHNDSGDIYRYDLTSLGKLEKPIVCADKKWEYHIALCGSPNIDVATETKGDVIVQTGKINGTIETHIVGTEIITRHGGENWVNLVLGGGDTYNHHCNQGGRKAQILFICDPDNGQGKPKILDEANDKEDFCFYMFEWSTNLVCPDNAKGSGGRGMSVFKLLLLEFVVIVVVYLVLGIGYKRYVLGARGIEQIPNLAFWKSCREGCEATANKIRGSAGSGIGGVRSDDITPRSGALNISTNDDDERLIM